MEGGQLVTQPVGPWQTYWDSVGNRDYYYNTVRTKAAPPLVPGYYVMAANALQ